MNILYIIGGIVLIVFGIWQGIITINLFTKGQNDALGADIKILGSAIGAVIIGLYLIIDHFSIALARVCSSCHCFEAVTDWNLYLRFSELARATSSRQHLELSKKAMALLPSLFYITADCQLQTANCQPLTNN